MGDLLSKQEKQEERTNVTEFKPRLMIGSGDGSNMNWLMGLKKGTMFAAKRIRRGGDTTPTYILLTCQILNKSNSTVVLVENLLEKMIGRVDPVEFTTDYRLVEILWEPEDGKNWPEDYEGKPQQQEQNHEQRDWVQGDNEGTTGTGVGDDPSTA